MPIFPFDPDEEERRRRLALTPPFNPDAAPPVNLPKIALPTVSLPASSDIPGGVAPPPPTPEPPAPALTRPLQLANAKADYLAKTPGRLKSALIGGLEALGRGEGVIGAATGGLTGAIAPRRLREQEFNARVRPQILERFGYEDQARAQELAAEKAARENAVAESEINLKKAQAYKNRLPPPAPRPVTTPRGALNPTTNTIIPGTEPLPRPERPAYRDIRDPDGKVRTYQIIPGQPPVPVGESGAAAISAANIRSHEGIAARHEAGENTRFEQRQTNAKPKPGSKGQATKEDIEEAFRRAGGHAAGYTLKGMKKHFKDQGYSVPE